MENQQSLLHNQNEFPQQGASMDFYSIVRSAHLNGYGFLFGGTLLGWVDEFAYSAAVIEFPLSKFVTRCMDRVNFTQSVRSGALLRFHVTRIHLGRTSVQHYVEVFSRDIQCTTERLIFMTIVTMVSVNEKGEKTPIIVPQKN